MYIKRRDTRFTYTPLKMAKNHFPVVFLTVSKAFIKSQKIERYQITLC